jgi:2,3-bisphosphoglycerate-independent phosphoglycerate mutase
VAETEKYAHVTFFFNNGREEPFEGEDRILVPSPRDVATYDHKPEMSAEPLTSALLAKLDERAYGFILVNFANPDMVGHTGVLPAAVKAVETIDRCLERVTEKILALGGQALVTADHGNCETMIDPETGGPHTAHTTNPVPIFWVTRDAGTRRLRDGGLADLAPSVLDLMGFPAPREMSGKSLIVSA